MEALPRTRGGGALLLLASLASGPRGMDAQVVRGRVTALEDGSPIRGAFVHLVDAGGERRAGALSGAFGDYTLAAPEAGSYRVRVEFIGRQSAERGPFTLEKGETVEWSPALPPRPLEVPAIEVEGIRRCAVGAEEGSRVAALWEEARKAFEIAVWAEDRDLFRYELVHYRRELDPDGRRVVEERRERKAGLYRRPFSSRPAGVLVRDGFVRETSEGALASAPDAHLLLADEFLDSHCFRLGGDEAEGVGLAFEPVRGRRVTDIRGVMWLDPETSELRSVTYRYVGFPGPEIGESPGGRVDFQRLPGGAWIVRRWSTELPVVGEVERRGVVETRGRELVGIVEEGGEVLRVLDREGSPVLVADRATLTGTVFDSIRGRPLPGAGIRVVGTGHRTVSGPDGSFLLAGLPDGRYSLAVSHPRLDSLELDALSVPVELEAGERTGVRVGIPTVVAVDGGSGPLVQGELLEEAGGAPAVGVLMSLLDAEGRRRDADMTDARGSYTIRAPAPGRYRMRAEAVGREAVESEPLTLEGGERRFHSLRLRGRSVPLEAPDPSAPGPCLSRPPDGSPVARAWEEVRKALAIVIWSQDSERFEYRLVQYERERAFDGTERRTSEALGRPVTHTFGRVPRGPDGRPRFVERTDSSVAAAVPGPRFLSSPGFGDHHCLALVPGASHAGTLTLEFLPVDSVGSEPDVRGLFVVDGATGLVRSFHYRYVRFPGPSAGAAPGGWMTFDRLPGGAYFVGEWERRLPWQGTAKDPVTPAPAEPFVAGWLFRGGYVTEARSVAGDVRWTREEGAPDDAFVAGMWGLGGPIDRVDLSSRPPRRR